MKALQQFSDVSSLGNFWEFSLKLFILHVQMFIEKSETTLFKTEEAKMEYKLNFQFPFYSTWLLQSIASSFSSDVGSENGEFCFRFFFSSHPAVVMTATESMLIEKIEKLKHILCMILFIHLSTESVLAWRGIYAIHSGLQHDYGCGFQYKLWSLVKRVYRWIAGR